MTFPFAPARACCRAHRAVGQATKRRLIDTMNGQPLLWPYCGRNAEVLSGSRRSRVPVITCCGKIEGMKLINQLTAFFANVPGQVVNIGREWEQRVPGEFSVKIGTTYRGVVVDTGCTPPRFVWRAWERSKGFFARNAEATLYSAQQKCLEIIFKRSSRRP